ncbi:MAG: phosphotransferase [Lachnospiraceae bacterium]|nr:phosphotransferase [Lachnospiraceae bacterium]
MDKGNNVARLLWWNYALEVVGEEKSRVGAGSDTWFVSCANGKYVMKYPAESEINHPEQEPLLCEYLNECGIPVCQFVKNVQGSYLTKDEQGRIFHVQRFIEGKTYEWHSAPKWLLAEMAHLLGEIHRALKDYKRLNVGIGEAFFRNMTPKSALNSYQNSLSMAKERGEEEIVEDLEYRIGLMQRFPEFSFDLAKLSCQSTHGDYFISQFLCGEGKINAIIDWTTACVHPVVWEIVRSYVYGATSCKDGQMDMNEFVWYVKEYCKHGKLNRYDMECMVDLFYYQIAVCDYYGQYYAADAENRYIYLEQAKLSTKLLRWLEKNREQLKEKLLEMWGEV